MAPVNAVFTSGSANPNRPAVLQRLRLRGTSAERPAISNLHSALEYNIAVFQDTTGKRLALVSLDALYVGRDLPHIVESRLSERFDLVDVTFLWCASHTHYAPAIDDRIPALGGVDRAYLELLAGRITVALEAAFAAPSRQVSIDRDRIANTFAVNRRLRYPWPTLKWFVTGIDTTYLAPNPGGTKSRWIDIVVFRDDEGDIQAVLWAMACHPTTFPDPLQISAEFPGIVRGAIRGMLDAPQLPVLFLQGFSGDLRAHLPSMAGQCAIGEKLRTILAGPRFLSASKQEWEIWSRSIGFAICERLRSMRKAAVADGEISVASQRKPLSEVVEDARKDFAVEVKSIQLTPVLKITAVNAEMSCGYEESLEDDSIPVGCADDCIGYIPTGTQVGEGGYEARRALKIFGTGSCFRRSVEATVTDMLRQAEASCSASLRAGAGVTISGSGSAAS